MDLPIDDKELEVIVRQLWKSRKNGGEPLVEPLYEKIKLVKEVRDENPDGSSWDIHDSGVFPIIVESLKEALAEIETLKTEVAALKSS